MSIIYRKAKLKDVDTVGRMTFELLKYHERLDPLYKQSKNALDLCKKWTKKCIYSQKRMVFVAEDNGVVIGFVSGYIHTWPDVFAMGKVGMITDALVDKKYRRGGVGTKLVNELLAWFREKKLPYAELNVHAKNLAGIGAWSKMGFKEYLKKKRKKL